ncbi:hypothetical protein EVAR_100906_1 [Eumeta japonica]|uniref:Uncharacterized protein n=1 Tax=Eumeta variegata TaxID=151549 RepID=A0A4C1T8W0_EUMVA|nr:hypothetical protein EVAR_100906_1 [Eumeta japonica]
MPEIETSALHAVINNENQTVIYSDESGTGWGRTLSGCMNHREHWLGTPSYSLVLSILRLRSPSAERAQYMADPSAIK